LYVDLVHSPVSVLRIYSAFLVMFSLRTLQKKKMLMARLRDSRKTIGGISMLTISGERGRIN